MLKQFPWSNIKEWSSHLFLYIHLCVQAKLLQSCMTLWDLRNCNLPGSSVHGILQETILEWVAVSSSRGSSRPRDQTHVFCISCISGRFFTAEPLGKSLYVLTCTICSWWTLHELSVCPSFIWSFVSKIYVTVFNFWHIVGNHVRHYWQNGGTAPTHSSCLAGTDLG